MYNTKSALSSAVQAIYFNDNSDYEPALWSVVKDLGGDRAVALLQSNPSAAFSKYSDESSKSLMAPYFRLMEHLRDHGKVVVNKRTGEKCYYESSVQLVFDLSSGKFPANTRRKIGVTDKEDPSVTWIKSQVGEWDGIFCRGITGADEFEESGTKVWYENANKTPAWLENPWRKGENDNGLIYQFKEVPDRCVAVGEEERDFYISQGYEVEVEGIDGKYCMTRIIRQMDELLKTLLTNPTDRRMIVTALHVGTFDKCSLPPCHHTYTFIYSPDGTLDIECAMRSWDVHLAFNIQLAAIFLYTVCRLVGMKPGKLTLNASNAHLYGNALDAVDEVLKRDDFEAPTLVISDEVKKVTLENYKGAFERLKPSYYYLKDYQSHPAIKTEMVK